jgi:hypothetical protein
VYKVENEMLLTDRGISLVSSQIERHAYMSERLMGFPEEVTSFIDVLSKT